MQKRNKDRKGRKEGGKEDGREEEKMEEGWRREGKTEKEGQRKKEEGKGQKLCPCICLYIPFVLETKFKFILLASRATYISVTPYIRQSGYIYLIRQQLGQGCQEFLPSLLSPSGVAG